MTTYTVYALDGGTEPEHGLSLEDAAYTMLCDDDHIVEIEQNEKGWYALMRSARSRNAYGGIGEMRQNGPYADEPKELFEWAIAQNWGHLECVTDEEYFAMRDEA